MLLKLRKRQGHQVLDTIHHVDTVLAVEQDADGLGETGLGLDDDLTTGATGTDRLAGEFASGLAGRNGNHLDSLFRILGSGSKDG